MRFRTSGIVATLLGVCLCAVILGQTDRRSPDLTEVASRIVQQTNRFRREQGLPPLQPSDKLRQTAQYFADYMAATDEYGHEADGHTAAERAEDHGYDFCLVLENIAYQYHSSGFTARELSHDFTQNWQESAGHRKNMLDRDVVETGVAVAQNQDTQYYYAVQMFGRPKSAQIEFTVSNRSPDEIQYEVDAVEYSLQSRFSRTHYVCRQSELQFRLSDDEDEEPTPFTPETGDNFEVRQEAGKLTVGRDESSEATADRKSNAELR